MVRGGPGDDSDLGGLHGGSDADRLLGGRGEDAIDGGGGDDVLRGGPGPEGANEAFTGGRGDDRLHGGADSDDFYCQSSSVEPGRDKLFGGRGRDEFCPGRDAGPDVFHGGPQEDTVHYRDSRRPLSLSLDGVRNDGLGCPSSCVPDNIRPSIEDVDVTDLVGAAATVSGSPRDNDVFINPDPDRARGSTVAGLGGDDRLITRAGDDTVSGGEGDDRIRTGFGDDAIDGGPDDDFCGGGPDVDTAVGCETVRNVP